MTFANVVGEAAIEITGSNARLRIMISSNHDAALPGSVGARAARLYCVPVSLRLLLANQLISSDRRN